MKYWRVPPHLLLYAPRASLLAYSAGGYVLRLVEREWYVIIDCPPMKGN